MHNPFDVMPMPPPVPSTGYHHLMRPINQRLPNSNQISNSNSASLPSNHGVNESAFRPASVINLSHSNDVVIGPMTQYQGSVTIYQYMDATVEASAGRIPNSGLGIRSNNSPLGKQIQEDKCTIFDKKHLQTWILVFILMVIISGVAVAIFLSLRASWQSERQIPKEILSGNEYEEETNFGNETSIVVVDCKQNSK